MPNVRKRKSIFYNLVSWGGIYFRKSCTKVWSVSDLVPTTTQKNSAQNLIRSKMHNEIFSNIVQLGFFTKQTKKLQICATFAKAYLTDNTIWFKQFWHSTMSNTSKIAIHESNTGSGQHRVLRVLSSHSCLSPLPPSLQFWMKNLGLGSIIYDLLTKIKCITKLLYIVEL